MINDQQYFLLHKTSIKLLFCKATYIIAEIQRVCNPEGPSKLQNSSAKVSRNSRKILRKKKKTCLGFGVRMSSLPKIVFHQDVVCINHYFLICCQFNNKCSNIRSVRIHFPALSGNNDRHRQTD